MRRALQIYRDGEMHESSLTVPLLPGEQGNMQTLEAMKAIVLEDRLRPDLRDYTLDFITPGISSHHPMLQMESVFEFARDRILYQQDPFDVELLSDMATVLRDPVGDCGTKTLFIATCAAILGLAPVFAVIKQRPDAESFSHVFPYVAIDGEWVAFDATPPESRPGWKAESFMEAWLPVFD